MVFKHLAQDMQTAFQRLRQSAWRRIFSSIPLILISIWMAVMPFIGAGNLEVHIAEEVLEALDIGQHGRPCRCASSLIRPMATPATGALMGTPASISARVLPQTLACEVEPLEESTSRHQTDGVGEFFLRGDHRQTARARARAPWPISRRPGLLHAAALRLWNRAACCSGACSA